MTDDFTTPTNRNSEPPVEPVKPGRPYSTVRVLTAISVMTLAFLIMAAGLILFVF
ncbi:MAG: hypothetical protein GYB66_01470 [Chloroflexi bacterium]|nr:hypothetical protein [Chloroflexota bacterium]